MKTLIDRASIFIAGNKELFKNKVGESVLAARRGGDISALTPRTTFYTVKKFS
jgi:hypothetical protein